MRALAHNKVNLEISSHPRTLAYGLHLGHCALAHTMLVLVDVTLPITVLQQEIYHTQSAI